MAIDLNNQTVMIYNNVYLGALISAEAESTPVYSPKGELEHVTTEVTIESIIPGGATKSNYLVDATSTLTPDYASGRTDDILHVMRNLLTQPRKTLYMLNSGFGSVVIDGQPSQSTLTVAEIESFLSTTFDTAAEFETLVGTSAENRKDLAMGPIPKILQWEPIGARGACRVVFKITFHTKECLSWNSSGTLPIGKVCSFGYKTSYIIDDMYRTVKRTTGTVKIHQNVSTTLNIAGFETLNSSADLLRDTMLMRFPSPANFKRIESMFNLSEDKRELVFTITDRELNSQEPFPANVLDMEVDHTVEGEGPGFVNWVSTLDGSITLKPGIDYWVAWYVFAQIAVFRLARGTKFKRVKGKFDQEGNTKYTEHSANPIPIKLKIREKMFSGKGRFEFSFSWKMHTSKADDIFAATGQFSSISNDTGYTWEAWKSSIVDLEYNPRGMAALKDNPNTILVNSCLSHTADALGVAVQGDSTFTSTNNTKSQRQPTEFNTSLFESNRNQIDEQSSLISYKNKIKLITRANSFEYQCAIPPDKTPSQTDTYYNGEGSERLPKLVGGIAAELKKRGAGSKTHTIEVAAPAVYLVVTGGSDRMLGPTPSPEILKVGGADVECINDVYESEKIDDSSLLPVYRSMWTKTYRVLGTPKNYVLKSNGEINPS